MNTQAIRASNLKTLQEVGYQVADWLPLRPEDSKVRPREEIVRRLAAIEAVCMYASAPPDRYPERTLREMIEVHGLMSFLAEEEMEIMSMARGEAADAHAEMMGWKMEFMVPLCWALGNELVPGIDGEMAGGPELGHILTTFAPGSKEACSTLLGAGTLRSAAEIVAMEDLFYCAHNAVRSALYSGAESVPEHFDPMVNGLVIQQRRHALTWMVSPGVAWDDTDVST